MTTTAFSALIALILCMIIASDSMSILLGRLVKDVDVFIRHEIDGEREPLFLSARHVVGILGDDFIQPAVFLVKPGKVDFFKRRPNLLVAYVLFLQARSWQRTVSLKI